MGKVGRGSETESSAATVPAVSRMTTVETADTAGNKEDKTNVDNSSSSKIVHRDKTKFGGQNRLRQKCLHRRCLLDTHRRNGGSGGPASTSEQGIYSGLELARLQHNSSGDHSIFSLLGRLASLVTFVCQFSHTGSRETLTILCRRLDGAGADPAQRGGGEQG